jgi:hypothetical protein
VVSSHTQLLFLTAADQIEYSAMTIPELRARGIDEDASQPLLVMGKMIFCGVRLTNAEMSPATDLGDEVGTVLRELQRRYASYGDIGAANDATRLEYISPVLISVVQLFPHFPGSGLSLQLGRRTSGETARVPVDFLYVYKKIQILVTEAKKDNLEQGIAQNVAQLRSAQQVSVVHRLSLINNRTGSGSFPKSKSPFFKMHGALSQPATCGPLFTSILAGVSFAAPRPSYLISMISHLEPVTAPSSRYCCGFYIAW